MVILVTVKLHAVSEKRLELRQFIQAILLKVRNKKGCHEAKAVQSLEDKNQLKLLLRWDTEENLSAFRRSSTFKALLGSKILLQQEPEIEFETVGRILKNKNII